MDYMDEVDIMDFRKMFLVVGMVLGLSGPAQAQGWSGWVSALLDSAAVGGLTMDSLLSGVTDGHVLKKSGTSVVGVAHAGSSTTGQILRNDAGAVAGDPRFYWSDSGLTIALKALDFPILKFNTNVGLAISNKTAGNGIIRFVSGDATLQGLSIGVGFTSGTANAVHFLKTWTSPTAPETSYLCANGNTGADIPNLRLGIGRTTANSKLHLKGVFTIDSVSVTPTAVAHSARLYVRSASAQGHLYAQNGAGGDFVLTQGGQDAFSGTAETDTVTVAGASGSSLYLAVPLGTTHEAVSVEVTATGFVLHRSADGAAEMAYVWRRIQ